MHHLVDFASESCALCKNLFRCFYLLLPKLDSGLFSDPFTLTPHHACGSLHEKHAFECLFYLQPTCNVRTACACTSKPYLKRRENQIVLSNMWVKIVTLEKKVFCPIIALYNGGGVFDSSNPIYKIGTSYFFFFF